MRSCDIHNLQFDAEYNSELRQHIVKDDSIRLVCPYCKHEHTEDEKKWMNINGGYIHKVPEKLIDFPRISDRRFSISTQIFILEEDC